MSGWAGPAPESERIEQEAAAWVLRQDRGLSAEEQDRLSQWLADDRRHGVTLARHRQNWDRLDQMGQWRPTDSALPNRDLLAPHRVERPWRRPWVMAFPLAAAVAIAAAFLIPQRPAPSLSAPTLSSTPAGSASAAAPMATGAAIEERTLDDGSVIALKSGAEVTVRYTPAERQIRLERGEAHFTVAKQPNRPFTVTVAGVDVRALGTQFDVRLSAGELDVLVTEGRVCVSSIPVVEAGEMAVVPLPSGSIPRVETVTAAQMDQLLRWRPVQLDFTGAELSDIVAEFNRHNDVQLVIADPALAKVQLSARLRSDNIAGFVRLLERGFDIHSGRAGDIISLRKAP